jgi:Amt family ammonium transporter
MIWRSKTNKIDESLDVFACHGVGGLWGALATGIFATVAVNAAGADGLIAGNASLIWKQLVGILATAGFSFGLTWVLATIVKVTMKIRVKEDEEVVGLDISQHGEKAFGGVF